MTAPDVRRISLSLPDTVEGSHFGNADFRVGGKIFATLGLEREGFGVLLLTPEQQAGMVEDEPEIFSPVPGGWGRQGSTRVRLAEGTPDILGAALRSEAHTRAAGRHGGRRAGDLFPGPRRMGPPGLDARAPGRGDSGHPGSRLADCLAPQGREAPQAAKKGNQARSAKAIGVSTGILAHAWFGAILKGWKL